MKYTFEQKMAAVRRKLEGRPISYPESCSTKGAKKTFRNSVGFWTAKFKSGGEDALRHGRNRSFAVGQKLAAIMPILDGKTSMTAQSRALGIEAGTLCAWIRRYGDRGTEGLECSGKGRRPRNMEQQPKKDGRQPKPNAGEESVDTLKARIKALEHTVLLQKAEIEYRKKLHALAEKRRGSGTSTGQGSSTSSAKAGDSQDPSGSRNGSPSRE